MRRVCTLYEEQGLLDRNPMEGGRRLLNAAASQRMTEAPSAESWTREEMDALIRLADEYEAPGRPSREFFAALVLGLV